MFRAAGEGAERLNGVSGEWEPLVGSVNSRGYMHTTCRVDGKRVWRNVHRVVWEVHNGPVPEGLEIDHINRDKTDNRISNLRAVTHAANMKNIDKPVGRASGIPQHRIKLLVWMPRTADYGFWASRWGYRKDTLLNIRSYYKKKHARESPKK